MTFHITAKNHDRLNDLIDFVLKAYADDEVELESARETLAHVIAALALGNNGEFLAWLDKDQQSRWLEEAKRARPFRLASPRISPTRRVRSR